MRTHTPEETAELCARFDARILALAVKWFGLDIDDKVGLTIASLPLKLGGNGLVVTSDVRHLAFADSEYRAISMLAHLGRHQRPLHAPSSQHDATYAHHLQKKLDFLASIGNEAAVTRLLEANSVKGGAGWLIAHRKWMPHVAYAAAWRLRARAVTTFEPAAVRCPACPKLLDGRLLDQREFVEHVHGCTRIPSGDNATRAHHSLTRKLVSIMEDNGGRATREPREYQQYKCPKCPFELPRGEYKRELLARHDKVCNSSLLRSGVDAELWLQHQRYLVDVTIAHVVCGSYVNVPIDIVCAQKAATKYHHYVEELRIVSPEEFVAAVAHSTGGLHVHFQKLLGKISREINVPYNDIVEDVRHCVMWGVGASIASGFRLASRRSAVWT